MLSQDALAWQIEDVNPRFCAETVEGRQMFLELSIVNSSKSVNYLQFYALWNFVCLVIVLVSGRKKSNNTFNNAMFKWFWTIFSLGAPDSCPTYSKHPHTRWCLLYYVFNPLKLRINLIKNKPSQYILFLRTGRTLKTKDRRYQCDLESKRKW